MPPLNFYKKNHIYFIIRSKKLKFELGKFIVIGKKIISSRKIFEIFSKIIKKKIFFFKAKFKIKIFLELLRRIILLIEKKDLFLIKTF